MSKQETKNNDITNLRFKQMRKTGRICKQQLPELEKFLLEFALFKDDDLKKYMLSYLKNKLSNKPLRAYFAKVVQEYLATYFKDKKKSGIQPDQLFQIHLPFIFEIIICIQYLDNQILDEKLGVSIKIKDKLHQNLLSANVLRELLFLYIDGKVRPLIKNQKCRQLEQMLRKLLLVVDAGQRIDKSYNTYAFYKLDNTTAKYPKSKHNKLCNLHPDNKMLIGEEFEWIRPIIEKTKAKLGKKLVTTELYFRRIYMTNVLFFLQIVDVILMLMNINHKQGKAIRRFAIYYGFMLQIINDYADFAHAEDEAGRKELQTVGRKTTDQFSDLRNRNITLPLIIYLDKELNRQIERYLKTGKKRILEDYRQEIMLDMLESGAIDESINLTRYLAKLARQELQTDIQPGRMLEDMTFIAEGNKFSKAFNLKP